jgi:hypothetical protein
LIEGLIRVIVNEPSFFNYKNQLGAEKDYLLRDAMPDWRQKAAQVAIALEKYSDLTFQWLDQRMTVGGWWNLLQAEISSWAQQAEEISIPDWEDMLDQFQPHLSNGTNLSSDKCLKSTIDLPTVTNLGKATNFSIEGSVLLSQSRGCPLTG